MLNSVDELLTFFPTYKLYFCTWNQLVQVCCRTSSRCGERERGTESKLWTRWKAFGLIQWTPNIVYVAHHMHLAPSKIFYFVSKWMWTFFIWENVCAFEATRKSTPTHLHRHTYNLRQEFYFTIFLCRWIKCLLCLSLILQIFLCLASILHVYYARIFEHFIHKKDMYMLHSTAQHIESWYIAWKRTVWFRAVIWYTNNTYGRENESHIIYLTLKFSSFVIYSTVVYRFWCWIYLDFQSSPIFYHTKDDYLYVPYVCKRWHKEPWERGNWARQKKANGKKEKTWQFYPQKSCTQQWSGGLWVRGVN